jgi:hypothetical protein
LRVSDVSLNRSGEASYGPGKDRENPDVIMQERRCRRERSGRTRGSGKGKTGGRTPRLHRYQQFIKDKNSKRANRTSRVSAEGFPMLVNHPYLSLVVPPQERILLAVALLCIAAVLAYFLVKALLYSAEHEYGE